MNFSNGNVVLVKVKTFAAKADASRTLYLAVLADKKTFDTAEIFLGNDRPQDFVELGGKGLEYSAVVDIAGKFSSVRLTPVK